MHSLIPSNAITKSYIIEDCGLKDIYAAYNIVYIHYNICIYVYMHILLCVK